MLSGEWLQHGSGWGGGGGGEWLEFLSRWAGPIALGPDQMGATEGQL